MDKTRATVAGLMFVLGAVFTASTSAAPKPLTSGERDFFEKKVRPVLVQHCYECHSTKSKKVKGGLLLDSYDAWMSGGDSGEVIIPGKPEKSMLLAAVEHEEDGMEMPPKYKLKESEIAALEKWIKMGAPDPRRGNAKKIEASKSINIEEGRKYWAFQPVANPAAPKVKNSSWSFDPIDRFVLAKLEDKGLKPVGDADRATLIRRATFDLTGLPPTPREINAFVSDPASTQKAFSKVVDRLLASKEFGVRWGRHWLDVARYAESVGGTRNYPFPFAWRYRDYVIKSFNDDKPFDRFVQEQIAGDLLKHRNTDEKTEGTIATGFLAMGDQDLNETDIKQYLSDVVDEQLDMTGRSFMAMTFGCARCHDHKFDPIAQKDYYAMAGIFYSTDMRSGLKNRGGGGNKGYFGTSLLVELDAASKGKTPEPKVNSKQKQIEQTQKDFRIAEKKLRDLRDELKAVSKKKSELGGIKYNQERQRLFAAQKVTQQQVKQLAATLKKLGVVSKKKKKGGGTKLSHYNYAMGVVDGRPADTKVHLKGDPHSLGADVPRNFLRVATDPNAPSIAVNSQQSGRLELARWIARRENPLTARVAVNRVWHHLFGVGLVRTTDNFGKTGEAPSHPELLDHLATRFMDEGWSVKQIIRTIMMSRVYQLSSDHDDKNVAVEPDNRLLWRANRRRLEVEAVRDAMLAVSGELDKAYPGPSPVMKYNPGEIGRNTKVNVTINGDHRSAYVAVVRQNLPEMWETFDFADPAEVKGVRDITTVAPQALFMMNNEFVLQRARKTAERLASDTSLNEKQRLEQAYVMALGRKPSASEVAKINRFLLTFMDHNRKNGPADRWAVVIHALFASAEFRYVN